MLLYPDLSSHTVYNILRQMLYAIQGKGIVFDPEIKKSIIVAETWLAKLYRAGHDDVGWGAFSDFAPQRNSTGMETVQKPIGYEGGKRFA